jgi:hypothetical protein
MNYKASASSLEAHAHTRTATGGVEQADERGWSPLRLICIATVDRDQYRSVR